jgi:chemotaxis protein MotB
MKRNDSKRLRSWTVLSLAVGLFTAGCVTKGEHLRIKKALDDQVARLRGELEEKTARCEKLAADYRQCVDRRAALEAGLGETQDKLSKTAIRAKAEASKAEALAGKAAQLDLALRAKEAELNKKEEELRLKADELRRYGDRVKMLQDQVDRLRAIFSDLQQKLAELVRSGKLTVRMVKGSFVVQLPERILFASGSAVVKAEGRAAIESLTAVLRSMKHRWQVAGHTDDVGGAALNWQLSTRRALAVLQVMLKAGMPPEQVSAAGFSEYQPVAPNDSAENRALNRRTELLLIPNLEELLAPVTAPTGPTQPS